MDVRTDTHLDGSDMIAPVKARPDDIRMESEFDGDLDRGSLLPIKTSLLDQLAQHTASEPIYLTGSLVRPKPTIITQNLSNLKVHKAIVIDSETSSDSFADQDLTSDTTTESLASPAYLKALPPLEVDDPKTRSDDEPTLPRKRSVRFNSRVRITSGIHRHRQSQSHHSKRDSQISQHTIISTQPGPINPARLVIPGTHSRSGSTSTISSSPSSSISAPLRSAGDDSPQSSKWGPLGQRVSWMASRYGFGRHNHHIHHDPMQQSRRLFIPKASGGIAGYVEANGTQKANERTPLVGAFMRSVYDDHQPEVGSRRHRYDADDDYDEAEYERLHSPSTSISNRTPAKDVEEEYGPWPGRLFNRHWWWWQLKPVICCLDESEDEGHY